MEPNFILATGDKDAIPLESGARRYAVVDPEDAKRTKEQLKPDKVIIPFEYENAVKTSYYQLELTEYTIERVALVGILCVLEGMAHNDEDVQSVSISFWTPHKHGWEVTWHITGQEFLDLHELKELRPSPINSRGVKL